MAQIICLEGCDVNNPRSVMSENRLGDLCVGVLLIQVMQLANQIAEELK